MPPPNNKSMMMNTRPGRIGGDSDESETPSNNLWVGNLASDVADSDLMDLFAQYGALDSVTSYSSRSYAFVFFKRIEDAKAAKDTLQGADLHGHPIKIEFARPAKPSKHLWVGGISPAVSKEELEEEFLKFGKVEDFKFLRDRNTAFVEYLRLEDASQAMRNMNSKRIGGEQIRVDFLRSQPTRREQWPDSRDGDFQGRSMGPADSHLGHKRQLHPQSSVGRKGDGQPSNVLWVGYPPSVQIDEQMLHNAMILFGEIERIKSFPSRHYSFVEFRSVDEARRAKEGLQGRLFNDPRISIMFSSSELAPGKEYSNFYAGTKGPRPEFFNEHPFRPVQMDVFGHNHPMVPNNFPGPLPSIPMRPFGRQGSLEPLLPGPEFDDLTTHHNFQDGNLKNMMGPNWKRPSPAPGMLPSPAQGIRPPPRSTSGSWDVLDMNQFQRGSKRSRIDDALSIEDAPFPLRKIDDRGLGLDQSYGLGPVTDGGGGPFANVQGKSSLSPVGARVMAGGPGQGQVDNDYIWRGIIAKGGTPVCQARCIPLGKGIESELPEVVNCSARTGLDMLTKHYADAIGFDIVFFLPDSEDDFASYTEFLRYLGAKNRAGVAKFDDGTTLFLVPPSDFLTNVLKVAGPERLYGVVLKFPQQVSSGTSISQQSHLPIPSSQYTDRQQIPPRTEYGVISSKEEQALPMEMDYDRVLHEDAKLPPKSHFPIASESPAMQPVPQEYASTNALSVSQAGVTLTPELIATLASLLPANAQSSGLESAKPALGSSSVRPSIPPQVGPNKGTPSQDWKQDNQASDHMGHPLQQLGNQFNPHLQNLSQYQPYPSVSSTPTHSASLLHGNAQIHDSSVSLPPQAAILSRPMNQSGQLAASPHVSQQYQHEIPPSSQRGYGMVNGMEASGLYSSQAFQPANSPLTSSNQAHGSLLSQPPSSEIPNQMQQLQSALFGAGQGTPEVEVDKNQRYQSTLQFAANLLLQIQQQQTTNQSGRGPGNQQ